MPLLSAPFRPFFLLTALIAVIVPMYFVCILINDYYYIGELINSFAWHGHEMVFGFSSALLTGFLLTASANWTGKATTNPTELLGLSLLWLFSRYLMFVQPNELLILFIVPLSLVLLLLKMFFILKGNRNLLPISLCVSGLTISQYIHLYGGLSLNASLIEIAYKLAGMSIFCLLFIFSGRLIPFFTNNRFRSQILSLNNRVEVITLVSVITSFIFYILDYQFAEKIFASLCLALMCHRTLKLFNHKMFEDLMVSILFVSHIWLACFFFIRVLNLFYPEVEVGQSSYHILFAGALASFALSIMTRAGLGHSGRKIEATLLTKLSFYSLTLGVCLRVFGPLIYGEAINSFLHVSMGFWTLGFILYLVKFIPIFTKKRADH
jgi:uncharacterized protein involved in response to NO